MTGDRITGKNSTARKKLLPRSWASSRTANRIESAVLTATNTTTNSTVLRATVRNCGSVTRRS
jgi:hypothetical protein